MTYLRWAHDTTGVWGQRAISSIRAAGGFKATQEQSHGFAGCIPAMAMILDHAQSQDIDIIDRYCALAVCLLSAGPTTYFVKVFVASGIFTVRCTMPCSMARPRQRFEAEGTRVTRDFQRCLDPEAAVWLLEQKADPSVAYPNSDHAGLAHPELQQVKNMEGYTALHWLAQRGMDDDSDVEDCSPCTCRKSACAACPGFEPHVCF